MLHTEEAIQEISVSQLTDSKYFTQSQAWAKLKSNTGWVTHAFKQTIHPTIDEKYLIFIKKIPYLGYLAYIPDGLLSSLEHFSETTPITQKQDSLDNVLDNKAKIKILQKHITQALEILSHTHVFLQTTYEYKLISVRWDVPPILEINRTLASIYKPEKFFKKIKEKFHTIYTKSSKQVQYSIDLQTTTQAPATVFIHLNKRDEYNIIQKKTNNDILLQCKKKTRYNIRLAEKNNIEIRTDVSLKDFHALLLVTAKRNRIAIHSLDYFDALQQAVQKEKTMELIVYGAYFHSQLIAAIVVLYQYNDLTKKLHSERHFKHCVKDYTTQENKEKPEDIAEDDESSIHTSTRTMYQDVSLHDIDNIESSIQEQNTHSDKYTGKVTYLYGASSNQHRELMSTYLLQWHAIVDAKLKKCDYYDLYGISRGKNTLKKSSNRLQGLYKFKTGFTKNVWIRPFAVDIYEKNLSSTVRKNIFNTLNKLRLWYYHNFKKKSITHNNNS